MRHFAFTVRDSAVEAFLPPFFLRSKGEAVRVFANACSDPEHMFSKSRKDYALYFTGYFDDVRGAFDPVPQPEMICTADEVLASMAKDVPI